MKSTSLFLSSLIAVTFTCAAQSVDSSLEKALDAPGSGYREMAGKDLKTKTIIEERDSQNMEKRVKVLENENSALKEQLKQLNLEYQRKVEILNSLDSPTLKKQPQSAPK